MAGSRGAEEQAAPLRGIRVVEFTHMVMGPTAGVILGDLGADVIKVEPLKGDNTRHLKGSGAGYFPMYNRNKRSIALDLSTPKAATSRYNSFSRRHRAGKFPHRHHGQIRPRLRIAQSRPPGSYLLLVERFLSGPYENRVALDEVTQMMGGLAYMTGLPDRPLRAGSSVIDITGGMFGVIAILSALHRRRETGEGSHVTSALFETTAFLVGQHMAQQAVTGDAPPPMSVRQSAWAVYDIFDLDSGARLWVGIVSDTRGQRFCEEFGLTDWAADGRSRATQAALRQERLTARHSGTVCPALTRRAQRAAGSGRPTLLAYQHAR